jgi:hypothetical protein
MIYRSNKNINQEKIGIMTKEINPDMMFYRGHNFQTRNAIIQDKNYIPTNTCLLD